MNESELRQIVQRAGYKLTPPRLRIISLLSEREGSFTASEALEALEAAAPEIGRATLFRTLDLLISLGALERVRLPGGHEGYVLCGPPHHHHIVCSSCGAIGEVRAEALEGALASAVRDAGFTLQTHVLELSGVCPVCVAGS